jgi:hypothetical protein
MLPRKYKVHADGRLAGFSIGYEEDFLNTVRSSEANPSTHKHITGWQQIRYGPTPLEDEEGNQDSRAIARFDPEMEVVLPKDDEDDDMWESSESDRD